MAFKFNGTGVTFASAMGEIRSVNFDESGREIEVNNSDDTVAIVEVGTVDVTGTVEINGESTIAVGDTGAFSVAWNSGGSSAMTLGVCSGKTIGGSVDQGIITTLTFKNTQS